MHVLLGGTIVQEGMQAGRQPSRCAEVSVVVQVTECAPAHIGPPCLGAAQGVSGKVASSQLDPALENCCKAVTLKSDRHHLLETSFSETSTGGRQ